MNRYFKFGVPIAVIMGALGWLALSSTKETPAYFKTIPEVKQMGDQAHVKHLRVIGYIKEGSIKRGRSSTTFLLVENPGDGDVGDNLTVAYTSDDPLPVTFQDHAQALADGKLGADGLFYANQIQVKSTSFAACSSVEFDSNKHVILRGRVTRMEWINPHVWIHLDVKGQDGSVVSWTIEGGTPNALLRNGLTKNSLPEGMEVVVDGYQAKDGTPRVNGSDITVSDGNKLFFWSQLC
jgi:cytochrome c-type biogenesis protein CcmE